MQTNVVKNFLLLDLKKIFNMTNILLGATLMSQSACSRYSTYSQNKDRAEDIMKNLGANEKIIEAYKKSNSSEEMFKILNSEMVQRMKDNTLSKLEWDIKYMKPDVLYIYGLGEALQKRAEKESNEADKNNIMMLANMFLGYEKHKERLQKYGLTSGSILNDEKCEQHIKLLAADLPIEKYYVAILTDMIPYVVFANYLNEHLKDGDTWKEYATKYGDLNNAYANQKLQKSLQIANDAILRVSEEDAIKLFNEGFTFEKYFIEKAFDKKGGFEITKGSSEIRR